MADGLIFEPVAHVYTYGDRRLPSVSQIVKGLDADDYKGIPDSVMDAAAARGRAVHMATAFYDRNDLDESSVAPEIRPYLDAYIKFRSETGFVPTAIELRVHHPALMYAGTLDRIGYFDSYSPMLGEDEIDIKTTAKIMRSVGPQLWGYSEAYKVQYPTKKINGRRALLLRADGTYSLSMPYSSPNDFKCFTALLAVHYWKIQNGK